MVLKCTGSVLKVHGTRSRVDVFITSAIFTQHPQRSIELIECTKTELGNMIIGKVKRTITQIKAESKALSQINSYRWFGYLTTDAIGMVVSSGDFHISGTGVVS
jgi:hypothetical protein